MRTPFIVATMLLVFIGIVIVAHQGEIKLIEPRQGEKMLEFGNIQVTGYKDGKKDWVISGQSGWLTKDEVTTHFFGVGNGAVYRGTRPLVKNLRAAYVRRERTAGLLYAYDRPPQASTLEAFRPLEANIDLHAVTEEAKAPSWYHLTAQELLYNEPQSTTTIRGDVWLKGRKVVLSSNQVWIDHKEKRAILSENLRIHAKELELHRGVLSAKFPEGEFEVTGEATVLVKTKSKEPTRVTCLIVHFYEDENRPATFGGGILAKDESKKITARSAQFNRVRHQLQFAGPVEVLFKKGKGKKIFKQETVSRLKNPEAQKAVEEETVLRCSTFVLNTKTQDASGSGDVQVFQKGKSARSQAVEYTHRTDRLKLSGDVEIQKEGDWLKTRYVTVSIADETFEAGDRVEARFSLKTTEEAR